MSVLAISIIDHDKELNHVDMSSNMTSVVSNDFLLSNDSSKDFIRNENDEATIIPSAVKIPSKIIVSGLDVSSTQKQQTQNSFVGSDAAASNGNELHVASVLQRKGSLLKRHGEANLETSSGGGHSRRVSFNSQLLLVNIPNANSGEYILSPSSVPLNVCPPLPESPTASLVPAKTSQSPVEEEKEDIVSPPPVSLILESNRTVEIEKAQMKCIDIETYLHNDKDDATLRTSSTSCEIL